MVDILSSTSQFNLNQSNQSWNLLESSVINTAVGYGIYESAAYSNNNINIYGDIYSQGPYGIYSLGTSTTVTIMSSSYISTPNSPYITGIFLYGANARLINYGTIDSDVVLWASDSSAVNYGKIFSSVNAHGSFVNEASGLIAGADWGVSSTSSAGQAKTTYNYGIINANYVSFDSGAGNDTLVNRGSMNGEIRLFTGDDTYDGTGGTLTNGAVVGGGGNDTYIISQANILLTEYASGGTDQINAAFSYTLGSYFENLTLIGTAATGTGNTLANVIKGNGSANTLYGMDGNDTIIGAAGSDLLYGGSGADVFVYGANNDIDTIKDFANGMDKIDVKGFSGISSFNDLLYNHAVASGANVVISSVYGTLIIENMTLAQLDATDFIF